MEKPFVKITRFQQQDVIATSGAAPTYELNVSGFKDGAPGNLDITFGGNHYNNYFGLEQDLKGLGLGTNTNTNSFNGNGAGLENFYNYDDIYDFEQHPFYSKLAGNVDGNYTWFATDSIWKHD